MVELYKHFGILKNTWEMRKHSLVDRDSLIDHIFCGFPGIINPRGMLGEHKKSLEMMSLQIMSCTQVGSLRQKTHAQKMQSIAFMK